MNRSSPSLQTRPRWFVPLAGVLTIVASACTSTATTRVTQSPDAQQSTPVQVPGIPNLPNLVTVVPFYQKENETDLEKTKVVIPAEVNGRRGIFVVDLGSPQLYLNRTFFQPTPTREADTVTDSNRVPDTIWDSVHAKLRIGTLVDDFADPYLGTSKPSYLNAVTNHMWGNYSWVFAPRLGNIGLAALEPFETIIDYTHQRMVLIRLDKTGHRLAQVPAYTPRWSAPLIDIEMSSRGYGPKGKGDFFWGVEARLGHVTDTLFFDTGYPTNDLTAETRAKVAAQGGDSALDRIVIADRTFDLLDTGSGSGRFDAFGYPFLSHLGVVGFNHRAHQFILYQ